MKWIKWYLIVAQATITNKSVVNFFGTRYMVYGNVVQRLN